MAGLAILTYHMGQNAQKAAESQARMQGFADAIKETGSVTEGVAAQVEEMFADVEMADLVKMFNDAGISAKDFSDALSGSDEEWDRFMEGVSGAGPLLTEMLNGVREEAQGGAAAVAEMADAMEGSGSAAGQAVDDLNDMGGALGLTGAAAEEAEELIGAFADAIDRLIGQAFDFEEASDALEQAIIDAGQHFSDQAENLGQAGLALDGISQAALDNREGMRGLIEQGADVIHAAQA